MPVKPMRPCAQPGCPNLIREGSRCAAHQLPEPPRPTARQRGYDAVWERIRAAFLRRNPYCAVCGKQAIDVHHILALRNGGTHDDGNLMSLCHEHHSQVTGRQKWHKG